MTVEERLMILEDLGARIPYGLEVRYEYEENKFVYDTLVSVSIDEGYEYVLKNYYFHVDDMEFVKPYLYSESDLTDEMKDDAVEHKAAKYLDPQKKYFVFNNDINTVKWCNKNKVDYRGLVGKGFALSMKEKPVL
jgi:hypothetical protein